MSNKFHQSMVRKNKTSIEFINFIALEWRTAAVARQALEPMLEPQRTVVLRHALAVRVLGTKRGEPSRCDL